jgi:hypothetical protein
LQNRRVHNGNHLSASERLRIKRGLLREGWFQNSHAKWEHPFYPARRDHQAYTLFGAAMKAGLLTQKGSK